MPMRFIVRAKSVLKAKRETTSDCFYYGFLLLEEHFNCLELILPNPSCCLHGHNIICPGNVLRLLMKVPVLCG